MKKTILLSALLFALLLAACSPAQPALESAAPTPTMSPEPGPPDELTPTAAPTVEAPAGKVPALSVETRTYTDETVGLLVDIPADWTVGERLISELAVQTQLTAPEGETQVSVTLYHWEPQNDLDAYVAQRKVAWEASGFKVLSEDEWVLDNGQRVMTCTVQTSDLQVFYALAVAGDRYLEFSGTGNLALITQIALTLRFVE